MKFIRVADGRFHSDPPGNRCGVMRSTRTIFDWDWANDQINFDPIAFGREALISEGIVKPCLHCFPQCKPVKK